MKAKQLIVFRIYKADLKPTRDVRPQTRTFKTLKIRKFYSDDTSFTILSWSPSNLEIGWEKGVLSRAISNSSDEESIVWGGFDRSS